MGLTHIPSYLTSAIMASDVEEMFKRLMTYKDVQGVMIINSEGLPIRTTFDNALTIQYAAQIQQLARKSQAAVRELDPQDELQFLRLRTAKKEIMVAPSQEFVMCVIQDVSKV